MGTILHLATRKTVVLGAETGVGRAHDNLVQLSDLQASNRHASIRWNDEHWEVRDFSTTNGTWVNEKRVLGSDWVVLSRGDVLRFGSGTERWELVDARGPIAVARSLATGEVREAKNCILALPNDTNLYVSILLDGDGQWVVESSDGARRFAKDAEEILVVDEPWQLEVPPASSFVGTAKANASLSMANIGLRFHVSHDGDHVRIDVVHEEKEFSLGTKTRFDILFHLAQRRWNDAQQVGLPEADHGWYDMQDLMRHLGKKEQYINTLIFRLRDDFAEAKVEGAEGIVERRPKQLRLGTGRILGLTE